MLLLVQDGAFFLSLSLSFDSHRVSAGVALPIHNKTRQDQAHVS